MKEVPHIEKRERDFVTQENFFMNIDRKSPEIISALEEAPIFRKFVSVLARQAIPGEEIVTILKDGRIETKRIAKDGDFVVTNPSGEQYILTADTFLSRHASTDEEGVYIATGHIRAIKNPFNTPIEIFASWGETQYGNAHCLIADICDSEGNNMGGEPYIIDAEAFNETYKPSTD